MIELYPCQLAVIEKRIANNEPISEPIYRGLTDYAHSLNAECVTLHCPITDRYCRVIYCHRKELATYFATGIDIGDLGDLCKECEYKKRIEEGSIWHQ